MLHILIADDHSIVRHGLKLLTEKVLEEPCHIDFAESGDEILKQLQEKEYALLLSDLMMPDQKGIALIGMALAMQPGLKIIIISVGPERDFARQCLESGACAYINKNAPDPGFTRLIRSVLYGDDTALAAIADTPIMDESPSEGKDQQLFLALSPREREVILLLLHGLGTQQIAHILSISASSVSTLKGRAFAKLKVQSLMGLSQLAYYHGLDLNTTMLS